MGPRKIQTPPTPPTASSPPPGANTRYCPPCSGSRSRSRPPPDSFSPRRESRATRLPPSWCRGRGGQGEANRPCTLALSPGAHGFCPVALRVRVGTSRTGIRGPTSRETPCPYVRYNATSQPHWLYQTSYQTVRLSDSYCTTKPRVSPRAVSDAVGLIDQRKASHYVAGLKRDQRFRWIRRWHASALMGLRKHLEPLETNT